MFKIYLKAYVTLFFLVLGFSVFGQGASNKGTDFWLGYGKHTSVGEMSVYITSDVATTATVSVAGVVIRKDVAVPANRVVSVAIPKTAHLGSDGLSANGIHITSLKPIIVYAHIYASSVSGATLVLPVNALGKEYYSINYKQISNSNGAVSWFFVVAVEDDTQVEITPSEDTYGGWLANTTYTVNLKKGEIYNVLGNYNDVGKNSSGGDLTGSKIKSISSNGACKKIAVFSGSSKISINCLNYSLNSAPGSADNLIQQAYPTDTWGKNFITVPQKERNFVIYRIVKSDPNAVVKVNGTIVNYSNDFYYDYASASQQVDQISADKPIQVVQYAVTQKETINCGTDNSDVGDPEMIYLNPLEQTLTKITMYSTGEYMILKHFINVVVKNDGVTSFIVDGQSVSSQFKQVPNNTEYSYAQLSVSEGTHNLSSAVGFNAIAYGFGAAESYGYAAGANLTAFGIEPISSTDPDKSIQTGCVGSSYDLTLKLPYQASQIEFDAGDGMKVFNLPTSPEMTVRDDKTTYIYHLIPNITYPQAQTYSYKVVTTKPSADACGSGDEFLFDFIINPKPVADFSAASEACLNSPISFQANQIPNQTITEYLWDFNGEVESTSTQSATHTYTSPGLKTNRLSVKSDDGCWSDVKAIDVEVVALPVPKFSYQSTTCLGENIKFTDESTSATNNIVKWQWDFGDTTSSSNSSTLQNPHHTFSEAKTYTVTLKVTTDLGCENTLKKQVTIHQLSVANFEMPDICLSDASALFTNTSTISDGTALSYVWDFGDGNSTLANNTSTLKNPTHIYTQAAVYNVSLTVTSANGCVTISRKPFTVNGSTPKALFSVQNEDKLCNDQEVIFEDLASVDFGEITKIEWIYDASKPSEIETDNNPATRLERTVGPKLYKHLYPTGFLEESKVINVIMNVYSGTKCVSSISKTINLKNTPNIVFNSLPNVCAEIPPFPFTQANETIGLKGIGVYSGDGISADGLFSPAKAGVGTHTITYTFIADNGCSATETQDITVFATPTVDAGSDKVILTGGQIALDARAIGKNVTYKWTPSTGLNRDDILNPIASPTKDIIYTLVAKSEDGCELADDVAVKVLEFPDIPNTFTPNGDGVNDIWNIKYLSSYPDCTIKVFNRDGKEVFSAQRYVPWDGKLNGSYLPEGMYYYIITAKSGELRYSGSLLLVK